MAGISVIILLSIIAKYLQMSLFRGCKVKRCKILGMICMLLMGCSNTKEQVIGNIRVVYFPKDEQGTRRITVGSPDAPFSLKNLSIIFEGERRIELTRGHDLVAVINAIYPDANHRDISGLVGPFVHPARSYSKPWPKGTVAYNLPGLEIYLQSENILGFDTCDMNNDLLAIEVNGLRRQFPLKENDIRDLFGPIDEELFYFSE